MPNITGHTELNPQISYANRDYLMYERLSNSNASPCKHGSAFVLLKPWLFKWL